MSLVFRNSKSDAPIWTSAAREGILPDSAPLSRRGTGRKTLARERAEGCLKRFLRFCRLFW